MIMDQSTNKIDPLVISNVVSLIQPTQTTKYIKKKRCDDCKKVRKPSDENHQICRFCYNARKLELSGNKVIDDFIKYTQTNRVYLGIKMKFVPYNKFKNVEFIAEGGFSKVYKAEWIAAGECQHVVL